MLVLLVIDTAAISACCLCFMCAEWTWIHCISVDFYTLVWREVKCGDSTVKKNHHCGVPRSLCNNTWWCNSCADSAAFPECLDRAQSGGETLRWYEEGGRLAGRMFRRIWPSFLPFFPPPHFSFLNAFLPLSPFLSLFVINTFYLLILSLFLLCRISGQQWLRLWLRKGSRS